MHGLKDYFANQYGMIYPDLLTKIFMIVKIINFLIKKLRVLLDDIIESYIQKTT